MKIRITLEITDPETVEAYKDVADELLLSDLENGSLIKKADLILRENIEEKGTGE